MNKNIFIAGFPEAGKTTFLASLFQLLDSKRRHGKGFYIERPKDTTYIDSVANKWQLVQELDRTRVQELKHLQFKILKDGVQSLELTVPDISGEIFKQILKDRKITKEVAEKILEADTILFFLHPEKIIRPRRMDNIRADARVLLGDIQDEGEETIVERFDYLEAPTQVHITDLLQIFKSLKQNIKVLLIVSAWDLRKDNFSNVDKFLESDTPLLSQFIKNNDFITAFGLSSNGGDPVTDKQILENMEPSERVTFHDGIKNHPGYDRLIEWLINEK